MEIYKNYVYEWIRLDTNEPFYIGKGKGKRCYVQNRGNNHHFNNIVKRIPTAVNILHDKLNEKEAYEYECYYIWEYRDIIGYDMCNIADGGEGQSLPGNLNPMYGRPWWDENTPNDKIEKWRQSLTKNRIGMKGKTHTKETKIHFSKIRKGRKLTEEWKLHIKENSSHWNLGKKLSEETRKRISDNHADVSGVNNPRAKEVCIYDRHMHLIYRADTVVLASTWLLEKGYINAINTGRSLINKLNKSKVLYKGLYFKK